MLSNKSNNIENVFVENEGDYEEFETEPDIDNDPITNVYGIKTQNENNNNNNSDNILLELGDIIQILSPNNANLHEYSYIIIYIDKTKIKLINVSTYQTTQLNIDDNNYITDETITEIILLSRSDDKGYCKQNGLELNIWLEIHFGGEISSILTGKITNVDEDMIEITTFPDNDVIYIDFEYKGLPEDIPIDKILIREQPISAQTPYNEYKEQNLNENNSLVEGEIDEPYMEITDNGEYNVFLTEKNAIPEETYREKLKHIYLDANTLFGEDLEDIIQVVEIPENEKRYGIDIQINDFTDELLSTIPNNRRNKRVLYNIHLLTERYKQLRQKFSIFDINNNIKKEKVFGAFNKPIVEHIAELKTKLQWIVPVVSLKKKLYDITNESELDVAFVSSYDEISEQNEIINQFFDNKSIGDENKYDRYISKINSCSIPYLNPDMMDDSKYLVVNKHVNTDLEAVVNNLGNFESTVQSITTVDKTHKLELKRHKYIIQRYNLGMSRLEKSKINHDILSTQITPSDEMSIRSFIILPEQVMKYSTVDLPGTNILNRVHLSHNYLELYRIFNQNTNINQYTITDISKELNHEEMEKNGEKPILSETKEYILDDAIDINTPNIFNKYLHTIFPNTRTMIRIIEKYITDKLSFVDVVNTLEPFMVYTDNITYSQYNEIRYFIKTKIIEFKKNYSEKNIQFNTLLNMNYKIQPFINRIEQLFYEKNDFMNKIQLSYKLLDDSNKSKTNSSSELLYKVITMDGGSYFYKLVSLLLISLYTPNKILEQFNFEQPPLTDMMSDVEIIKPTDCIRRFITKRYSSIRDLSKDNNTDIYYDKEFDDTAYDILKQYKEDQKKYLPEKFIEFLAENLIRKHDCPPNISREMAITIISGKKLVKDGEYAIVEIKPKLPSHIDETKLTKKEKDEIAMEEKHRLKTLYYKRYKNHWITDKEVESQTFIDTNTLFCNINKKCTKNTKLNTCDSLINAESRMQQLTQTQTMNEFDKRYSITVDDLETSLIKQIEYQFHLLKKNALLNEIQLYKSNNLSYELGKYAKDTTSLIESPYVKLRELILSQSDFVKKQMDICKFIEDYCREPMVEQLSENQYWFYCKLTNTQLFPYSLYILADTYVSGGNYQFKLDEICKTHGELSEDGDSIVDKYTGRVLRIIDFVGEDTYDDNGFKLTTHDIIEKDLGSVLLDIMEKPKTNINKEKIFENETTQTVYNILLTICKNIGISIETVENFTMRTSLELINTNILKEKSYYKQCEIAEKKTGKPSAPYNVYRMQTIFVIIGSVCLINIQTMVPSLKTNKSFPGCSRSFSGYPMSGGIENTTGIQYIACVIDKSKSAVPPWNTIQKLNSKILTKRMLEIIEKYLLERNDVKDLYLLKKEYNLLNNNEVAPKEHSITKWIHFMPPVVQFSLKSIHGISSDFENNLLQIMRSGHKDQREHFDILKSKVKLYTYGIIECINNIVKSKDLLLKTASRIPFLENACCNENDIINPLKYFITEDETIKNYLFSAIKHIEIYQKYLFLSKPSLFYHEPFSGINYPVLPVNSHIEENIYASYIYYCNFDNNIPIPNYLASVCNEKPKNYNILWTMEEKIEHLKKIGKRYNINHLYQLMKLVNRQNVIYPSESVDSYPVNNLKYLLSQLELSSSSLIESPLRKMLSKVLDNYNPKIMVHEDSDDRKQLRKYLTKTNQNIVNEILQFIDNHGNLNNSKYNLIQEFILSISTWNIDSTEEKSQLSEDTIFTITNFIKNSVFNLSKIYPNIIINNASFNTIPPHLTEIISDNHKNHLNTILNKYSDDLSLYKEKIVNGNTPVLKQLLKNHQSNINDLLLFIENLPVYTPIKKQNITYYSLFDTKTTYLLFSYCWYSVLYEFILATDNEELMKIDVNERKQERREQSQRQNDVELSTNEEDIGEEEVPIMNETEIRMGNKKELKVQTCSLLIVLLEIERINKKTIDMNYSQITKKVSLSKENEKKTITDYFENMERDERKLEDQMKKLRIGRWNIGLQKGIFKYDATMYDKETTNKGLTDLYKEIEDFEIGSTAFNQADTEMVDTDELEKHDENVINEMYEEEQYNIDGLDEDYGDGNYYNEDQDRDFGYDE